MSKTNPKVVEKENIVVELVKNSFGNYKEKIDFKNHEVHFYFNYPLHKRLAYSKHTIQDISYYINKISEYISEAEKYVANDDRERLRTKLLFIESNISDLAAHIVLLGSAFPDDEWKITPKQFESIKEEAKHA